MLDVRRAAPTAAPAAPPAATVARSVASGLVLRLPLAVAAGLLLVAAFPPYDAWPAAPASVAAFLLVVRGIRSRAGALVGLAYGAGFFVPLLQWSGVYVGPAPWLILAASQAAFLAALGAALAAVTRLPGWPVWAAALWVTQEALRSRLPYTGFPWGRLGFGLADSPYLHLAPIGGVPLMGFAAALTGALAAAALVAGHVAWRSRGSAVAGAGSTERRGVARAVLPGLLAALLVAAPLAVPLPAGAPDGSAASVNVALVQGNVPRLGLDFNAQRRAVLRNHVARTGELAARVRAGEAPRPDLVIWPENSSDIDPFLDPEAYQLIDTAVRDIGVPVLVGALLSGPGRYVSNTGIVWDPVTGPGQRYVKRQPVPFAEYIPMRRLARLVSDKVDLVARDFAPGQAVGLLDVAGVRVGDLICFEVGADDLARDVVAADAQVIAVQTNNATFGFTPQTEQQLAMSRVRAVEHGRTVLVAATSGVSAVVAPDGSVTKRAELYTPAILSARVPLVEGRTPASRVAPVLEWALGILSGIAVLAAAGSSRRRRGTVARGRPLPGHLSRRDA